MKIRQGFVSNSSSSSFIIHIPDGNMDFLDSTETIIEKLIKDNIHYGVALDIANHIMYERTTSTVPFEDLKMYECRDLLDEFKYDDDFLNEVMPILQKYYDKKNKNKIGFDVQSYEINLNDFEWNPEKYLKLPFEVERYY